MIKRLGLICCLMGITLLAHASGGGHNEHIERAPVNLQDKVSLQEGAKLFVNYCYGCHSLKYLRYERLAEDLIIPAKLAEANLMFVGDKIGSPMNNAMDSKQAAKWFGAAPPDLTLEARLRGADWLYSYLINFYPDPSRPWGVNNRVFKDVGMPHVLESLESELGEEGYKDAAADITNFLVYAAEPSRLEREHLGVYVLLFLAVFMIPVYFLNREYWKNIH